MNVAGVAIMILALVLATGGFAFALLKTYIDKRQNNALTSFIATTAISITLLCVLIIPVDIYIVSSGLESSGAQSDPSLTARSAHAIQSVYYALWIVLLVFAFILLPFTYFYFEEDDSDESIQAPSNMASRMCTALKFTAGFVVFFLVLMALGLVLKKGHQDESSGDWRAKLSNDFTGAEAILSFCLGCLACVGLTAYVVYAAYGLARIPMKLMSKAKALKPSLPTSAADANRTEDLELSLRRNEENLKYLQTQYDMSGRQWTKEDLKQLQQLKQEQRRLQSLRNSQLRTGQISASGKSNQGELSCWDKCWNVLMPFRMVLGIPLLLVSLLLVTSLSITVVDKFKHSTCGPSCGYSLAKTHILNPLDEAYRGLAKVFPLDCLFFALLVLYVFLACVSGIVGLGVRVLWLKLHPVQKQRTPPNAYLMAAWLLQLMALVLNMEVLTLAPNYATFGNQFYLNTTSGVRQSCDTDLIGVVPDTCVQTQIGRFINTLNIETPFFAVILFYGNLAFLAFFLLFLVHGFFADHSKKEEVDAFRRLADESDED